MAGKAENRRLESRVPGETIAVEILSPIPRVRDLSSSGLYLIDSHPLHLGETIEMRLTFDSGDSIVVRGMVRRIDPGQGMAIEFTHIDAAARRRVKQYISNADPKKISPAGPLDV